MEAKKYIPGKISGLALAGSIYSLITEGGALLLLIEALLYYGPDFDKYFSHNSDLAGPIAATVVVSILCILQTLSLIFNILFLKKKTDSLRRKAGVFSLLGFSIIGGVFLLCGRVEHANHKSEEEYNQQYELQSLGIS